MTKKQCPLGEACDLTTAWMAGRQHGIDWFTPIIEAKDAEIERLRGELAKAVEALERVSNSQPRPKRNGDYDRSDVSALQRIARTTLAELTEPSHD